MELFIKGFPNVENSSYTFLHDGNIQRNTFRVYFLYENEQIQFVFHNVQETWLEKIEICRG